MQKYRSLLPQNDLNLENYQDAIDYALDTDGIRNIALSGSYGSGKSSVINSYEQAHQDKRFIHITLADFREQNLSVASSDKNAAENLKGCTSWGHNMNRGAAGRYGNIKHGRKK